MEKEFEEAELLSVFCQVFSRNPRIFINRLNLIRNIPIGIMEIFVLQNGDLPVYHHLGMKSSLPFPFPPPVESDLTVRIPSSILNPLSEIVGLAIDEKPIRPFTTIL